MLFVGGGSHSFAYCHIPLPKVYIRYQHLKTKSFSLFLISNFLYNLSRIGNAGVAFYTLTGLRAAAA